MTCISCKGRQSEWTLFLDTYNNEIIAHSLSSRCGDNRPYYDCLDVLKRKIGIERATVPVVLHTDQRAVHSSRAFGQTHIDYNIIRSMSRAGTPTDNPVMEALNGWMKDELTLDFGLKNADCIAGVLESYIHYFNNDRSAYALGYKSPVQYKTEQGFLYLFACLLLLDKFMSLFETAPCFNMNSFLKTVAKRISNSTCWTFISYIIELILLYFHMDNM